MSGYKIKSLQERKAKDLNVIIKSSESKNKKIDVFDKKGNKLASIGGVKQNGSFYGDYATFIEEKGLKFANERRRLYLKRHSKYPKKDNEGKPTRSYFATEILW